MASTTVKDQNSVAPLLAVLDTDGKTVVALEATNNTLDVNIGTTGSNNGPTNAIPSANSVSVLMAVSETDGITPVVLYADALGNLLVDSM